MNSVISLARPEILALRPYASARSLTTQGSIFLDANESPLSPTNLPFLNRYPEPQPLKLLERFSRLYNVPPSMILIGRGSDEAIDLLVRTFCTPGKDQILICPPTYGMYEVSAQIQGAQVLKVPLQLELDSFSLNVNRIIHAIDQKAPVKIIFLCSPNNPTGTAFDSKDLVQICEASRDRCIVVIDEAYAELSEELSMIAALTRFPHLVVLRTLSKAWAAAGARCGVAIAQNSLIQLLQKVRPPYPMSTPAILAILEATQSTHQELLQQRVNQTKADREWIQAELLKSQTVQRIYPSSTNFLLVKFYQSSQILRHLKSKGIIVRDRSTEPGLTDCIRITVGTKQENQLLILAIQEALL